MSNRSLLEFNHDYCPQYTAGELMLGHRLRAYMRAADTDELPPGVIRKHYRHHSEPEPIKALADALREARELIALVAKNEEASDCDNCRSPLCDEFGCLPAPLARIDAALKAAGCE